MKIRNIKQVKDHVRDMSMKRLFRRNQIIITTLAVMIAAAGYLNYAGKKDLAAGSGVYEAGAMDISDADILAENQAAALTGEGELEEIPSLDQDFTELEAGVEEAAPETIGGDMAQAEEGQPAGGEEAGGEALAAQDAPEGDALAAAQEDGDTAQTGLENPGEAVLTSGMSVADYIANVQLSREQVRARNKETLMNLINSSSIDEASKQQAIQDMIQMTEISEKENAAETLLIAKGFADPVVSISSDKVDVVINASSITDPQRAQIEDIVKRKAEVGADQIIITLLNMAE